MGGDQAAAVLALVGERDGDDVPQEERKARIRDLYTAQGSPYYSTARLWDDGVIDPIETRRVLGMGLALSAASASAPMAKQARYGVFRM